jgi:hypothetical protein
LIAEHHADSVAPHAAGEVSQHRMSTLNIDAEVPADENLHYFTFHLDQIVSRQIIPFRKIAGSRSEPLRSFEVPKAIKDAV